MNYKKPAFLIIIVVAVIACVITAVYFLTNPSASANFLKVAERNSSGGKNQIMYEIDLDNEAMGGTVYAEQWRNGICVRSTPVTLPTHVEDIQILMNEHRDNESVVGIDIQIDTHEYGGSHLTYFAFPEDNSIRGWSFSAYEKDEIVKVSPGDEKILAAMAFDEGNGVRSFDCETLINEPAYLEKADYMIVIRACFGS